MSNIFRRTAELMGYPHQGLDVEFIVPLPAEECREKLLHAQDNLLDKRILVVAVSDQFSIRKKQFITNRYTIPLFLIGKLTPSPEGTRVSGQFRFHIVAGVTVVLIFGLFGFYVCNNISFALSVNDWTVLTFPIGAFFASILIFILSLRIGRSSGTYLSDWLHESLSAVTPGLSRVTPKDRE